MKPRIARHDGRWGCGIATPAGGPLFPPGTRWVWFRGEAAVAATPGEAYALWRQLVSGG